MVTSIVVARGSLGFHDAARETRRGFRNRGLSKAFMTDRERTEDLSTPGNTTTVQWVSQARLALMYDMSRQFGRALTG